MRTKQELQEILKKHNDYKDKKPFPHTLLKNLVPDEELHLVVNELDDFFAKTKNNGEVWRIRANEYSKKYGTSEIKMVGEKSGELFEFLFSEEFVNFLSELTGIKKLIADQSLKGGGFHLIGKEGFLKIHADFNYHPQLEMYRRVNLLLYLNENWDYGGGDLELWDKEMKNCVEKYPPLFNHCVVFNSSDYSYHGHPNPLICPGEVYRKSIAVYYYTKEKPEDTTKDFHSTIYK